MGLWRVDGKKPVKLSSTGAPLEEQLEQIIEMDPSILGEPLLIIGRQVATPYGKTIDLLAVDADGALNVLELKRNRTEREVVAQILDYGSWVATLTHQQVLDLFAAYRPTLVFEQAFIDCFGGDAPTELNSAHRLTIIAGQLDPPTQRIVEYVSGFGVPINAVLFNYYKDADRAYLARTWLLDTAEPGTPTGPRKSSAGSKEPWNGTDWYVSFGEEPNGRSWDDACKYGFVSAGGGEWFSKTLRNLPVGARVFVYIPKVGYVGVGHVSGEAQRFNEATVQVHGELRKLKELALNGTYDHAADGSEEDLAEYIVPVTWQRAKPGNEAVWKKAMFANQNSACKLRNKFTIETLATAFELDD